MKKFVLQLLSLVCTISLPGVALAFNSLLKDVNDSCGYDVATDCIFCHQSNDYAAPTPAKAQYLADGACSFCTEVASCSSSPPTETELYVEAQRVNKAYFETLFSEFSAHMADAQNNTTTGNPFADVFPACAEIAPVIASDFSRANGYLVRRVTERTRNSRNIPDDWELQQLRDFNKLAADGAPRTLLEITRPDGGILPTKEFEAYEVVLEADVKARGKKGAASEPRAYFRYMRSITMPPMPASLGGPQENNPNLPCLLCHGDDSQVSEGVRAKLAELYPHDQAMGYKPGDIRGAWTIKIPLSEVPQ